MIMYVFQEEEEGYVKFMRSNPAATWNASDVMVPGGESRNPTMTTPLFLGPGSVMTLSRSCSR